MNKGTSSGEFRVHHTQFLTPFFFDPGIFFGAAGRAISLGDEWIGPYIAVLENNFLLCTRVIPVNNHDLSVTT